MILDILRNHLELDIIEALFLELDHCSKTRAPHIVKLNQLREVKLKGPNRIEIKRQEQNIGAGKQKNRTKQLKNTRQYEQLKEKEGRRRECS